MQTDETESCLNEGKCKINNNKKTPSQKLEMVYLSLYYNNIRGMSGKKDHILLSTEACIYDVIILTETWLNKLKFSGEFFDPRFIVYRKDRVDSSIDDEKGGGVLIAIDSKYDSEIVNIPELDELEAICVKIQFHSTKSNLYIYGLYIQHGADEELYSKHLNAIQKAQSLVQFGDIFAVIGDFNLRCIKWIANDDGFDFLPLIGDSESKLANIARTLSSSLLNSGLFQMTDFQNEFENVLDLVYTNMPELFEVNKAEISIIPNTLQDKAHVPMHCMIECEPTSYSSSPSSEQIYCFKKAPFNVIRDELLNTNFDELFADKNLDEMLEAFYNRCYDIFDQFIPKASLRSTNHPVWYDGKLINLKNRRNRAYMKLRNCRLKNGGVADDSSFLAAKDEFEVYQYELFNAFMTDLAKNYKKQPKKFWNHINSKFKKNSLPGKMFFNNEHATNDTEKANLFAKFFASVYRKYDNDNLDDIALLSFLNSRNDDGYLNIEVNPDIVCQVLIRMDLSKGMSPDKLAPVFLRECADIIAKPLTTLYAKSLADSYYPTLWKNGYLMPIFKSGVRADISNYRGACVSPNLAKVFEIIVFSQIKINIFPHIKMTQHGFFPGRRVESNLMELSILVHDSFENGSQTDIFYADIHKAFDVIPSIRLIMKLADDKYRISNSLLLWFRSFFKNRKQLVKVNSSKSEVIDVHSGVGQGSILASLSFLVYFNDSDGTSVVTKDINFADDKKIVHNNISSVIDTQKLQSSINDFIDWCANNDFELNKDKCKILSITRKRSSILVEYYMNGEKIKRVESNKDLGVTYNNKFSFNDHYELASNKGMSMLSFIKRQCYGRFNVDTAKLLYSAVVRSHLEFASTIWAPYHKVHIQSLESIQRQFVLYANRDRHIEGNQDEFRLRPYVDRCEELNLKSLLRRRTNTAVFFIHDVLTGKINSQLIRDRIKFTDTSRTLRNPTRMISLNEYMPDYIRFSSFNFACRLFNSATIHVDPSLPTQNFRRNVEELDDTVFASFGIC